MNFYITACTLPAEKLQQHIVASISAEYQGEKRRSGRVLRLQPLLRLRIIFVSQNIHGLAPRVWTRERIHDPVDDNQDGTSSSNRPVTGFQWNAASVPAVCDTITCGSTILSHMPKSCCATRTRAISGWPERHIVDRACFWAAYAWQVSAYWQSNEPCLPKRRLRGRGCRRGTICTTAASGSRSCILWLSECTSSSRSALLYPGQLLHRLSLSLAFL